MSTSDTTSLLRATNYDNFKDLSYFVSEHERAKKMMEEIDKFYVSFLKSKLICASKFDSWPGKMFKRFEESKKTLPLIPISDKSEMVWNSTKSLASIYKEAKEIMKQPGGYCGYGSSERKRYRYVYDDKLKDFEGQEVEIDISKPFKCYSSFTGKKVRGVIERVSPETDESFYASTVYFTIKLKEPLYRYSFSLYPENSSKFNSQLLTICDCLFSSCIKDMFGEDSQRAREEIYNNPALEQKLKTDIAKKFNTKNVFTKNIVFYQNPNTGRLVPFDSILDFSDFKFETCDIEDKRCVFVTRSKAPNEGLRFSVENGNFLGYYKQPQQKKNKSHEQ